MGLTKIFTLANFAAVAGLVGMGAVSEAGKKDIRLVKTLVADGYAASKAEREAMLKRLRKVDPAWVARVKEEEADRAAQARMVARARSFRTTEPAGPQPEEREAQVSRTYRPPAGARYRPEPDAEEVEVSAGYNPPARPTYSGDRHPVDLMDPEPEPAPAGGGGGNAWELIQRGEGLIYQAHASGSNQEKIRLLDEAISNLERARGMISDPGLLQKVNMKIYEAKKMKPLF